MVVVFGSINVDLVMRVPNHPVPGETVLADALEISPGGKGANQAIAAARMGAAVQMCGAVGDDAYGIEMRSNLARNGVDVSNVREIPGSVTGCATITVSRSGENSICVAAGANWEVRAETVPEGVLGPDSIIVTQMEVPPAENWALLSRAKARGARTLLNLAPAVSLDDALVDAVARYVDFLVVNETEAAKLLQALGMLPRGAEADARALAGRLNVTAIVTLGAEGACAESEGRILRAASLPVPATDTTGAGDCFVGVLADRLQRGEEFEHALTLACAAGALACTKPGAQSAMPDANALRAALAGSTRF